MTFNMGDVLGFFGGALCTFGFIPQVVRVLRLKSAREISLPFSMLFLVGVVCWLSYGIYFRLVPVVIWNLITSLLASVMLYAKLRYGRSP